MLRQTSPTRQNIFSELVVAFNEWNVSIRNHHLHHRRAEPFIIQVRLKRFQMHLNAFQVRLTSLPLHSLPLQRYDIPIAVHEWSLIFSERNRQQLEKIIACLHG
jgi:hypothetical protein